MKLKGLKYGRGGTEDVRYIPGIGRVSEVYVGQHTIDPSGRGTSTVVSMELDPRSGRVFVRRVDQFGKPQRLWTTNETVREHERGDVLGIDAAGSNMIFDDEPKDQQQGQQKR
jgi:hypothetical protein